MNFVIQIIAQCDTQYNIIYTYVHVYVHKMYSIVLYIYYIWCVEEKLILWRNVSCDKMYEH